LYGEVYAYLKAGQTPRPARVAIIGTALHDCGVPWASVPVALYAAGHNAAVVAFLVQLAETGKPGERAALDL